MAAVSEAEKHGSLRRGGDLSDKWMDCLGARLDVVGVKPQPRGLGMHESCSCWNEALHPCMAVSARLMAFLHGG